MSCIRLLTDCRDFILQSDDLIKPAGFDLIRHIVFHLPRGLCAGPFRVFKHIGKVESCLTHEAEGLLMLFLSLATETCDDISGKRTSWQNPVNGSNSAKVPLTCIFPVHTLQHAAAAALHRKVNVPADIVVTSHDLKHIVRQILWVGGGIADAQLRVH